MSKKKKRRRIAAQGSSVIASGDMPYAMQIHQTGVLKPSIADRREAKWTALVVKEMRLAKNLAMKAPKDPSAPKAVNRNLRCPACQAPAHLVSPAVVYGQRTRGNFGDVWICSKGCDTRVGSHPDGSPMGTLAGPKLRQARIAAHAAFDGWWRAQGISRGVAYRYLANRLGEAVVHIGSADEVMCARIVREFATGLGQSVAAAFGDLGDVALAMAAQAEEQAAAEAPQPGERAINLKRKGR